MLHAHVMVRAALNHFLLPTYHVRLVPIHVTPSPGLCCKFNHQGVGIRCISADEIVKLDVNSRFSQIRTSNNWRDLCNSFQLVRIRLTRKLAGRLNGIDVSYVNVTDIMELPAAAAAMLIAEGWAEAVAEPIPLPRTNPTKPLSAT